MSKDVATIEQLKIMERKLYRFVTPFMALTLILGFWMLALARRRIPLERLDARKTGTRGCARCASLLVRSATPARRGRLLALAQVLSGIQ